MTSTFLEQNFQSTRDIMKDAISVIVSNLVQLFLSVLPWALGVFAICIAVDRGFFYLSNLFSHKYDTMSYDNKKYNEIDLFFDDDIISDEALSYLDEDDFETSVSYENKHPPGIFFLDEDKISDEALDFLNDFDDLSELDLDLN